MLITTRKIAFAYRARLTRAIDFAEDMGCTRAAEAFEAEREALEHHVRGACVVALDELEVGFPIDPPFDPMYPKLIRNL